MEQINDIQLFFKTRF